MTTCHRGQINVGKDNNNNEQSVTITEVLANRVDFLQEAELWAVCRESLLSIIRGRCDLVTYISPDTLLLLEDGSVVFDRLRHCKQTEAIYLAPEIHEHNMILEKACLFSLGVTLYSTSGSHYPTGEMMEVGPELESLILDMTDVDPAIRPSLDEALSVCDCHEETSEVPSYAICQFMFQDTVAALIESEAETNNPPSASPYLELLKHREDWDSKTYKTTKEKPVGGQNISADNSSRPLSTNSVNSLASAFQPIKNHRDNNAKQLLSPPYLPRAFTSKSTHFSPIVVHSREQTHSVGYSEEVKEFRVVKKLKELHESLAKASKLPKSSLSLCSSSSDVKFSCAFNDGYTNCAAFQKSRDISSTSQSVQTTAYSKNTLNNAHEKSNTASNRISMKNTDMPSHVDSLDSLVVNDLFPRNDKNRLELLAEAVAQYLQSNPKYMAENLPSLSVSKEKNEDAKNNIDFFPDLSRTQNKTCENMSLGCSADRHNAAHKRKSLGSKLELNEGSVEKSSFHLQQDQKTGLVQLVPFNSSSVLSKCDLFSKGTDTKNDECVTETSSSIPHLVEVNPTFRDTIGQLCASDISQVDRNFMNRSEYRNTHNFQQQSSHVSSTNLDEILQNGEISLRGNDKDIKPLPDNAHAADFGQYTTCRHGLKILIGDHDIHAFNNPSAEKLSSPSKLGGKFTDNASPSPSKDSGVSGVNATTYPSLMDRLLGTDTVWQQQLLQQIVEVIKAYSVREGSCENEIEEYSIGEYVMSLSGLKWETFTSAITEKYSELYWTKECLSRLYQLSQISSRQDRNIGNLHDLAKDPTEHKKVCRVMKNHIPLTRHHPKSLPLHHYPLSASLSSTSDSAHSNCPATEDSGRDVALLRSKSMLGYQYMKYNTESCLREIPPSSNMTAKKVNMSILTSRPLPDPPNETNKRSYIITRDNGKQSNMVLSPSLNKRERNTSSPILRYQLDCSPVDGCDRSLSKPALPPRKNADKSKVFTENCLPSTIALQDESSFELTDSNVASNTNITAEPNKIVLSKIDKLTQSSSRRHSISKDERIVSSSTISGIDPCVNSENINENITTSDFPDHKTNISDNAFGYAPPISQTSNRNTKYSMPSKNSCVDVDNILANTLGRESVSTTSQSSDASSVYATLDVTLEDRSVSFVRLRRSNVVYHSAELKYCSSEQLKQFIQELDNQNQMSLENKKSLIDQQIAMERKSKTKTQKFYKKLSANKSSKNDQKTLINQVAKNIKEMTSKLEFLEMAKGHLEMLLLELYSLNISLLYSFASQTLVDEKTWGLEPNLENPLLHFHICRDPSSSDDVRLLHAGSPSGLISFLYTSSSLVNSFTHQFLFCFRYFLSPEQLWSFITDRYRIASRQTSSPQNTKILRRSVDILFFWLEGYYSVDFQHNETVQQSFNDFLTNEMLDNEAERRTLQQLVLKCQTGRNMELSFSGLLSTDASDVKLPEPQSTTAAAKKWAAFKAMIGKPPSAPIERLSKPRIAVNPERRRDSTEIYFPSAINRTENFSLLDYTVQQMSEQLSLIEQDLFQSSHPVHFLDSKWRGFGVSMTILEVSGTPSNRRKNREAVNCKEKSTSLFVEPLKDGGVIERLIHHNHRVTHWVAAEILSCSTSRAQLSVLTSFINIACTCLRMRNFGTCLAIVDALESLIIRQLPAWKQLPVKCIQSMAELSSVKVSIKNNSSYLTQCKDFRSRPTIPYTPVFLLHVQRVEIGGFKLVNGMYKWTKMREITELIDQIRMFKDRMYALDADPRVQDHLLRRIKYFADRELQMIAVQNDTNYQKLSNGVLHGAFRKVTNKLALRGDRA